MKDNGGGFLNIFMVLGLLALAMVVAYRLVFYSGFLDSDIDQEEELEDLVFVVDGVSFVMKPVKGGSFLLKNDDGGAGINEYQEHSVILDSYYLGETEVTQELWQAVMGTNVVQQRDKANPLGPLRGMGSEYPMYYVSWYECNEFIRKLNLMTGRDFRFPTEAEWEYAAKGGDKRNGYKYAGSNTLSSVAWYAENSGNSTHMVKDKMSNELGLYDMIGNVWEWCGDSYNSGSQYYVLRGGSWYSGVSSCRLTTRHNLDYGCRETCYGMRLAMNSTVQKTMKATYLRTSDQTISFADYGETRRVEIYTDGKVWDVANCPSWITNRVSGNMLLLSVSENNGMSQDGTVILRADDITTEIKVAQFHYHEYVDLGLPSGTQWAVYNVGAKAPEEYGNYFAWGETKSKNVYDWSTYEYSKDNSDRLIKYCTSSYYGFNCFTDNLTVLQPMDDAATVNWGDAWHTPTADQWQELIDFTTKKWVTKNGVKGWSFTAANGRSIFLPSAGYRWEDNLFYAGENTLGYYWSSSLAVDTPTFAIHYDSFSDVMLDEYETFYRSNGFPVRPVRYGI